MKGIRNFSASGRWHRQTPCCQLQPILNLYSIVPDTDICSQRRTLRPFSSQHASPSRSVDFSNVKQGIGNVVATAVSSHGDIPIITHLSTVSHKSPVRLIPTTTSVSSFAKQISIGHYGGGMTEGDTAVVKIHVQKRARLHVRTQGTNRVYGHGNRQPYHIHHMETTTTEKLNNRMSNNSVEAVVDDYGFLVYAPDPVSLHAGAQYHQCTKYLLKDPITSNLVGIDWICSGRRYSTQGEHWNHKTCTTRTTLQFDKNQQPDVQQRMPTLVDAQSISAEGMKVFPATNQQFHSVVTVILSGSMVVQNDAACDDSVVQRFLRVQSALATQFTAVRLTNHTILSRDVQKLLQDQLSVGGRVVVGVTKAITSYDNVSVPLYTVRLAATSNEDVYRILHFCLQPIAPHLGGIECYKDRIVTASKSPPTTKEQTALRPDTSNKILLHPSTTNNSQLVQLESSDANSSNYWAAFMLADSALPIGSFAHSSGIEVASQLGFLQCDTNTQNNNDSTSYPVHTVAAYVTASVTSTMQLSTPLLWCSSHITKNLLNQWNILQNDGNGQEMQQLLSQFDKEYRMVNSYAHALFATNGPSCRASLDQGRNLLRVAQLAFVASTTSAAAMDVECHHKIMELLENAMESSSFGVHMTTVLGVVSRLLNLNAHDTIRLYGYCVARDIVNAAVRLNLIGPMDGQAILLQQAQAASNDGIHRAEAAFAAIMLEEQHSYDLVAMHSILSTATGCAPILDAIHPCHDILATRLFRT
jgi:urease accessory protein UreF/urease accessory protein UreH